MLTVEDLKNFGADTEEGLGRCFGKEDFYIRLVGMIPDDPNFDTLAEKIKAGDLQGSFEAAHALKGVLGNLSLTPIYEPVSEMTELLRKKEEMDYMPLLAEVQKQRDRLKEMLASE